VFPNLNYSGLYQAVRNIIDVVRLVQYGQHGWFNMHLSACLLIMSIYRILGRMLSLMCVHMNFYFENEKTQNPKSFLLE
jgi:hypothetical protein